VDESEMDQTIKSMTFEVDLSAFNSNNPLNKSADLLNPVRKSGKKKTKYNSNRRFVKRKGMNSKY
jgi:hypothetical protein